MPQIQIGDDIAMSNGIVVAYQTVTGTHTISSTSNSGAHDYIIGANTTSAAVTVNLPTDSARELGRMYYIVDSHGNSSTNNITIDAGSDATINGSQTYTINSDYTCLTVICIDITTDAEKWTIV